MKNLWLNKCLNINKLNNCLPLVRYSHCQLWYNKIFLKVQTIHNGIKLWDNIILKLHMTWPSSSTSWASFAPRLGQSNISLSTRCTDITMLAIQKNVPTLIRNWLPVTYTAFVTFLTTQNFQPVFDVLLNGTYVPSSTSGPLHSLLSICVTLAIWMNSGSSPCTQNTICWFRLRSYSWSSWPPQAPPRWWWWCKIFTRVLEIKVSSYLSSLLRESTMAHQHQDKTLFYWCTRFNWKIFTNLFYFLTLFFNHRFNMTAGTKFEQISLFWRPCIWVWYIWIGTHETGGGIILLQPPSNTKYLLYYLMLSHYDLF